jgi:transposase InsO family protein
MPWQEMDTVSKRLEFVKLAGQPGANIRELCRREQISPKTGYKWLGRYEDSGGDPAALQDRSRRPLHCEQRTPAPLEQAVIELRARHPSWGGRKIARRLADLGRGELAASTVSTILQRHGLIEPGASERAAPVQRFEHERPNQLWQMDFKGQFNTVAGACYPLTILDDHSRFNLALRANERIGTAQVQPQLQSVFERYGLPARINTDNGPPWGAPGAVEHGLTALGVWLIRLGITVSHSRPMRPQTNGKIERFHRTLDTELIAGKLWAHHQQVQHHFDRWRRVYNLQRPHEAIEMQTPVQRYQPSPLRFPRKLAPIEYRCDDTVLNVRSYGATQFRGRKIMLSRALAGLPVAVRACPQEDGSFDIYFCHQRITRLDLREMAVDT